MQEHPSASVAEAESAGASLAGASLSHRAPISATAATVDQVHTTAYDPFAARRASSRKLVQAVYLLFGVIEVLVALRFVLRLLDANPEAGFAQMIYGVTAVLVAPFVGLFGASPASSGNVLDVPALLALAVYALLGWGIARQLWLVYGETRSATATASDSVRARTD